MEGTRQTRGGDAGGFAALLADRGRRHLCPGGQEMLPPLLRLGQRVFDIDHAEHDAEHGGDDAQHRGGGGLGAQYVHRDQILDRGRSGDHAHRKGAGAQRAGHVEVPGDVELFKQILADGDQHEYAAVQVDAADGQDRGHDADREHRQQALVFGRSPPHQRRHLQGNDLCGAGIAHDLCENGTQGKHQEIALHKIGEPGHVGLGHRGQDIPARKDRHHQGGEGCQNIQGNTLQRKDDQDRQTQQNADDAQYFGTHQNLASSFLTVFRAPLRIAAHSLIEKQRRCQFRQNSGIRWGCRENGFWQKKRRWRGDAI